VTSSERLDHATRRVSLTRGLGRAYGDAALPGAGDLRVAHTAKANRFLHFDAATGELTAEAGVTLEEIVRVFLPRGYFTPVSPGTRFVPLGGMVAADVHGKNHHTSGTIGRHVVALTLRVADESIVVCSRTRHADLFRATLGGMGLTGHILDVTLRLERVPSPWVVSETEQIPDLAHFIQALRQSSARWPMTAGWIDCLSRPPAMGRGVLFRGRWAEPHEAPVESVAMRAPADIPFNLPSWMLGRSLVRAFNFANYHVHGATAGRRTVAPGKFFYPLDSIGQWNRIYGRRGFAQYQCVLPDAAGPQAVWEFFDVLSASGGAGCL
jgi:FAD/FMN-containing dehydrogenase